MILDLRSIDAQVAEAQARLARGLEGLDRLGEAERKDPVPEPLGPRRDMAGQTTYRALAELVPSAVDVPWRDGLVRWVHELTQARIAWDLVVDESNARNLPDPSLPRDAVGIARTFEEARRELLGAAHPVAIDRALARLDVLAVPVVAVRAELGARRREIASRLGLADPWALATSGRAIDAVGRAVLDATEPLAEELVRRARKSEEPGSVAAKTIAAGFVRDADQGWPAHLVPRWLEEAFGAVAPRVPRGMSLPEALGGASFLRAADRWGRALRLASTARALPFGLARDPYPFEVFAHGALFAVAVAGPVFGKRKLGLSARAADGQARRLARAALLELRRRAAEVLPPTEELSARLHGEPLAPMLARLGSFSGQSRLDAPARLVGLLRGDALARSLVARFDEDWFDNPRAQQHLTAIAAGPVWSPLAEDETRGLRAIVRELEERLG